MLKRSLLTFFFFFFTVVLRKNANFALGIGKVKSKKVKNKKYDYHFLPTFPQTT